MSKKTFKNLKSEYREDLLNKAAKRFVQTPYEKIKIEDLAKAMELPIGTFYSYFEDKKDLFIEILRVYHEKTIIPNDDSRPILDENLQLVGSDYKNTEDEERFADYALGSAPTAVLNDFFSTAYIDMISLGFKDAVIQKMLSGEFRKDLDIDLVLHLYATLPSSVLSYCRSKKIYDRKVYLTIRNKVCGEYFRRMLVDPDHKPKTEKKKTKKD